VNSFGKAFAHVRNCLLKKKHMAQTKTLTDSTRKRHKKEDSASFVEKLKKMVYRPIFHLIFVLCEKHFLACGTT
jgi:hypothetical protein